MPKHISDGIREPCASIQSDLRYISRCQCKPEGEIDFAAAWSRVRGFIHENANAMLRHLHVVNYAMEAEDVTQDVCRKIWQRILTRSGRGQLTTQFAYQTLLVTCIRAFLRNVSAKHILGKFVAGSRHRAKAPQVNHVRRIRK